MNSQFGIVRPVFTNNVNKFISIVLRADNCVNNWHLFCDRQTKMSSSLDDEIEPWKCENVSIEFFVLCLCLYFVCSDERPKKTHNCNCKIGLTIGFSY